MDDVLNTSLLSIAQLCRIGCVATFSAKDVTVTYNNLPVLYGLKSIDDNHSNFRDVRHSKRSFLNLEAVGIIVFHSEYLAHS